MSRTRDLARLHVDSDGNVGVGYDDPGAHIHVVGSTATPTAHMVLQSKDAASADAKLSLYARDSSNVNHITSVRNHWGNTIIEGGKVGINASLPNASLQIDTPQDSGVAEFLRFRDASAGSITKFESFSDPSFGTSTRIDMGGAYGSVYQNGTEISKTFSSGEIRYNGAGRGLINSAGLNYSDIRSPEGGIGGWVSLGPDQGNNPYPRRAYKIAQHDGANGTRVYQVWHNGDANYYYGSMVEIRINSWYSQSTRFESVSVRCVNGRKDDIQVYAYPDTNGIWITTTSIWGNTSIRKAGWDDGLSSRGASYCAVDNGGPLQIGDVSGIDGAIPGGYTTVTADGGYYIENGTTFNG